MRMDYELFGDIVTFDTTFATNKDHRPLGVFIGFNHYREQVIFGASLLYDETQASFNWVFSTFLEAHDFKKPTTLFTDQDIAMGNAISVVMPEVRHAGKVYTPKIFELFQRQWEKSLLALVGNKQERGRLQEYLIVSCDEEGEYVVTHDEENATLSCSCNKFETVGILCGHALKVLDVLGIKYIPETYILKRWTRGARDGCALDEDGRDVHRSGALDVSDRYRELWPDAVRLAHKASEFKDGYLLYKTKMKELDKEIEELRKKHYECTDHGCEPNGNKGVDKNAIESLVGNAGLDDTLLSSLSQGSNRAQFNGKKVMGEFNMLGSNHIQSGGERVFGDLNVRIHLGRTSQGKSYWITVSVMLEYGGLAENKGAGGLSLRWLRHASILEHTSGCLATELMLSRTPIDGMDSMGTV
ncbi:hypothetical protein RJ640_027022 [Escallonia rubra]|uniref:SWIM-type domain-containing protein n=1 Tax=Escallonia rubra TaxID=112253 RepID=A0AA88UCE5_9ASTE|nr:hypothetical protein RJ640_027022 [Escallonia rubra]